METIKIFTWPKPLIPPVTVRPTGSHDSISWKTVCFKPSKYVFWQISQPYSFEQLSQLQVRPGPPQYSQSRAGAFDAVLSIILWPNIPACTGSQPRIYQAVQGSWEFNLKYKEKNWFFCFNVTWWSQQQRNMTAVTLYLSRQQPGKTAEQISAKEGSL